MCNCWNSTWYCSIHNCDSIIHSTIYIQHFLQLNHSCPHFTLAGKPHINRHLNSRQIGRSGKWSHSQLYSCQNLAVSPWLLNLAVTAATKGKNQVVLPSDLNCSSAGLGSPFQKQQLFSVACPGTLYATTAVRPEWGSPCPSQHKLTYDRSLKIFLRKSSVLSAYLSSFPLVKLTFLS